MGYKTVQVPCLGVCTLFPVSQLPRGMCSYKNLLKNAELLGLKEIPRDFAEQNLQLLVDAIANSVGAFDTVWLSGSYFSYPSSVIFTGEEKEGEMPQQVLCVDNLEFICPELEKATTCIEVVTIDQLFISGESTVCLFLGSVC